MAWTNTGFNTNSFWENLGAFGSIKGFGVVGRDSLLDTFLDVMAGCGGRRRRQSNHTHRPAYVWKVWAGGFANAAAGQRQPTQTTAQAPSPTSTVGPHRAHSLAPQESGRHFPKAARPPSAAKPTAITTAMVEVTMYNALEAAVHTTTEHNP